MIRKGFADIVLGLQYGDEGKARIVDYLAPQYDIVARFNGGANAGHTIEKGNTKIALQQIPSGVFYPKIILYIGSGCAVNIVKLANEIESLKEIGLDVSKRLRISCQASIIQPHHIIMDELFGKTIGTTKNGIGPSYADRAMRMYEERLVNIRLADLVDQPEKYFTTIMHNAKDAQKNYKISIKNLPKMIQQVKTAFEKIKPFIEPDPLYLEKRVKVGSTVLFEGAQSTMLDVSKGSVPFVTSSSTIAAAAYVGGDLSPKHHRKTIGIAKVLMSRVGFGPFPSEFGGKDSENYCMKMNNGQPAYPKSLEATYRIETLLTSDNPFNIGKALRILSNEYGTITTRPRRIGMLDLVQLNHSMITNGVDELILTKCDLLKEFSKTKVKKIPLVTSYLLGKKEISYIPGATSAYYRVKPNITYMETFTEDISNLRTFDKLPKALKKLLKHIEETGKCTIVGISVGPNRDQFVNHA